MSTLRPHRALPSAQPRMTGGVAVISLDAASTERISPLDHASPRSLVEGSPVRTFRMHRGQQHWSGSWWCATTGRLEIYESRHELARLVLADYDPHVARVLSQPFTLRTVIDGTPRRHTPDFLFLSQDNQPVVVDVKLASRVASARVAPVLAWTREAIERRGWAYEMWTGVPDTRLANVKYLAGYRNPRRVHPEALDAARGTARAGMTVGEALAALDHDVHPALARPALLHMLWNHDLGIDIDAPLTRASLLAPAAA